MQVMVPYSGLPLVPVRPDRVERLRAHLERVVRDLEGKRLEDIATGVRDAPAGFPAIVVQAACSLCRGWCCRKGGDDAYLDDRTLARARLLGPDLSDGDLVQTYLDRVPELSCEGSCVFHGGEGCTLDRSMRSDVCNRYFCGGLEVFMESGGQEPTMVIAGAGQTTLTSLVLVPEA